MFRFFGRRRRRREAGETLVELVLAVTIMSIAVVSVVGALATGVRVSDLHRKHATAGAAVRALAEALHASVAGPSGYLDDICGGDPVGAYQSRLTSIYTPPTNYQASVTQVRFWHSNGSTGSFESGCPDVGVQLLTLQVASVDGRVTETLDVVLRKPCRTEDPLCA
jgi:type II secretory pathway pseudopilin PulG